MPPHSTIPHAARPAAISPALELTDAESSEPAPAAPLPTTAYGLAAFVVGIYGKLLFGVVVFFVVLGSLVGAMWLFKPDVAALSKMSEAVHATALVQERMQQQINTAIHDLAQTTEIANRLLDRAERAAGRDR